MAVFLKISNMLRHALQAILLFLLCSSGCAEEPKKLALLFMTRSDLNQPDVWKQWINPAKCTIYNHSKTVPKDLWLAQYRIPDIQPNAWGYLLLAQQALLKEALKNPFNEKFIFLSESCVPLYACDQIYSTLMAHTQSHMRWYDIWWKGDPNRTLAEFPKEHHFGNHQWIILNRKHAQMIAEDNDWIHLAMQHLCCDEAYPSTFFSMCGLLHEFRNELTTFVDWHRGAPYVFITHNQQDYEILIDAKYNPHGFFGPRNCLFARKFSSDFPPDIINRIILSGRLNCVDSGNR